MSKKTWTTILIVLLVIAAAIAIYFVTLPKAAETPVTPPVLVTEAPTMAPTEVPTAVPTEVATQVPTEVPTAIPTEVPTVAPTMAPTMAPIMAPTVAPTKAPAAVVVTAAPAVVAAVVEPVKEALAEAPAAVAAAVETVKEAVAEAPAAIAAVVEPVKEAVAEAPAAVVAAVETAKEAVVEAPAAIVAAVETAVAVPAQAKTKVTIWHTFTADQEAYLKKAVEDFNASQDSVEVALLSQPYAGFTSTVYSAVVEGIGPDIIFNYASEASNYVKAGLVADLGQYIYDEKIGIPGFDGSLTKGVMEGEVNGFEDGLIHYLPAYTTGPILYYNKTLFDELQITPPTTWAEMEAASQKIFEAKSIAGLGVDSLTDLMQMLIMETPGAGYIDVANKAVLFDTPEVRAKVQWLVDMVKKGYFLLKPSGDYFSTDFNSGIIASYVGSSAGFPYIKADGFEFAMSKMPAETWYPSWNRGPIVFYYKDDARAQAAYEFVKYFISAPVNAGWVESVTALTPYSWTKEVPAYQAYVAQDSLAGSALKAVEANLPLAGSLPAVTGSATVRTAIQDAVIKAAGGQMTVDEAWTECVTVSNAALKGE